MSITGAIHAEWANEKRKAWLALLIEARKSQDWSAVDELIKKMTHEESSE